MIRYCTCENEEEDWTWDCVIHVSCDDACDALLEPTTYEEAMKTLEHYKNHSFLSGCSHGN